MALIKITPSTSEEGFEDDTPHAIVESVSSSMNILAQDISASTTNQNFQSISVNVNISAQASALAKMTQDISASMSMTPNDVAVVSPISVALDPVVLDARVKTFSIATVLKPDPIILTTTVPGAYYTNSVDMTASATVTTTAPDMTLTNVERLGLLTYEYNNMDSELTEIKLGETNG